MRGRVRHHGRSPLRGRGLGSALGVLVLVLAFAVAIAPTATGGSRGAARRAAKDLWRSVGGTPPATHRGNQAVVRADRFRAFVLDRSGMRSALQGVPLEETSEAVREPFVAALPAPDRGFQRFVLEASPVMEPALAALHPEITTYRGVGVDDPAATIRADLTPLGFHASVRSPRGGWYIDPYYHLDQSLYVSYFTRDAEDLHGAFIESEPRDGEDAIGALDVEALAGPTTGTQLRTYRLALLSNPAYATTTGGPRT